jgi:type I restriction enzyme S subunit
VVSYLRKICDALDAQSERVSQAISLLQEYRSALITNAVSGKIDVRNFEIPLTAKEPAHA